MATFEDVFIRMENWGMTDVMLPFLLIFAILFAVLSKVNIFGGKKNINVVVALIISLLVVIPHVTGDYPPGADVVEIINTAIPNVTVFVVGIIMLMIMVGVFGVNINIAGSGIGGVVFLISIIIVGVIFADAAGVFGNSRLSGRLGFLGDPDTQALIVVLLVFGMIVMFITGDGGGNENIGQGVQNFFQAMGKTLNGNN